MIQPAGAGGRRSSRHRHAHHDHHMEYRRHEGSQDKGVSPWAHPLRCCNRSQPTEEADAAEDEQGGDDDRPEKIDSAGCRRHEMPIGRRHLAVGYPGGDEASEEDRNDQASVREQFVV